MLMPKRAKYRKQFRGRMRGYSQRGNTVNQGEYGLQAWAPSGMPSAETEAPRRAIVRYVRRGGKVWIKVFPDKPVTAKAAETRMGSGKGAVDHWVAVVRPGRVLFEIAGVSEEVAKEAMERAAFKLPIRTQFVKRETLGEG